jgi:ATP-dependent RNA helicase MSS116, mitochondrial
MKKKSLQFQEKCLFSPLESGSLWRSSPAPTMSFLLSATRFNFSQRALSWRSSSTTRLFSTTVEPGNFDSVSGLSPATLRALKEKMGFTVMTPVQNETLPMMLRGNDVLARAKTGTGKTVAFMLPCVEKVLAQSGRKRPGVSVLVISPTRELANQIAAETKELTTFQDKGALKTACVVGGTNIRGDMRNLKECDVVVGTPGRLLDHIDNTPGFADRLGLVKTLVFDECDRLLDMGFRRDIERITSKLPASRQTLLFSATMPQAVHKAKVDFMKPDHTFVDTVGEEASSTHDHVEQHVVVSPRDGQFAALEQLLQKEVSS